MRAVEEYAPSDSNDGGRMSGGCGKTNNPPHCSRGGLSLVCDLRIRHELKVDAIVNMASHRHDHAQSLIARILICDFHRVSIAPHIDAVVALTHVIGFFLFGVRQISRSFTRQLLWHQPVCRFHLDHHINRMIVASASEISSKTTLVMRQDFCPEATVAGINLNLSTSGRVLPLPAPNADRFRAVEARGLPARQAVPQLRAPALSLAQPPRLWVSV